MQAKRGGGGGAVPVRSTEPATEGAIPPSAAPFVGDLPFGLRAATPPYHFGHKGYDI